MSKKPDVPSPSAGATRELILRCLDGAATDAERAELDELVARDPTVATELARAAVLESALEAVARADADQARVPAGFPLRRGLFERRRATLLLVAAAILVSGIAVAFVVARPWKGPARSDARAPAPAGAPESRARGGTAAEAPPVRAPAPPPASDPSASTSGATPAGSAGNPGTTPSARAASVADSLKAANQLRRQGRWGEAERAYGAIVQGYPGTAQSSVAALAAASLRLEHLGDPRGALRLYQSVRTAELSAEAELGIANCYRKLGDRPAEIAALQRFLSAHPRALSRERAEERLKALQSGNP